jgi:glycosyltransferase involved in cell wall biosynthesis
MAHFFKHHNNRSKGILVFTHKEMYWLNSKISRTDILKPRKLFLKILLLPLKKAYLRKIRKYFFVGIHWGRFHRDVTSPWWADFNMTAPGTCTFKNNTFIIPLNSANFTPSVMKPAQTQKYWDIICVAKNIKEKNNRLLLQSIKKIFTLGYEYRVILIIASNLLEPNKVFDNGLLKYFYKTFSNKEKKLITILKTDPKIGGKGLPLETIAHFYNQSKIFTIFSQEEGESRVIKEAQLCGLPVVVKSDIRGGGADYLNQTNSLMFQEYDDAAGVLIQAVKNYDKFDVNLDKLRNEIGELENIEKLKQYFHELFENFNFEFDGELINTDNLNWRLPAQYSDKTTPWAQGEQYNFQTSDVLTIGMLKDLIKYGIPK